MQEVSEVKRINAEEEDEELLVEVLDKKSSFSWLATQMLICAIIVSVLIALKEYLPETYNMIMNEYSEIAAKTLLLEDGEINIIPKL